MQPYYQDEWVTLYHGDCLEITEWLSADVLVTDPPYGMDYQSGQREGPALARIAGDTGTYLRDMVASMWGPVRPALIFGTWRMPAPAGERLRLIWAKDGTPGMGDLRMPWGPAHEDIHVLGQGWSRITTRRGSVIHLGGVRGGAFGEENATGHPTPKPTQLMEYLITACPTGTVADPFAGSGSTLVAAKNQDRRAIGVELEERYCEVAAKRLAQDAFDFAAG